jgi:hypothetical protein
MGVVLIMEAYFTDQQRYQMDISDFPHRRNLTIHKKETRFDSIVGEPLQVSWNRRIRDWLGVFISKSIGFFNQNSGFWKLVIIETIS